MGLILKVLQPHVVKSFRFVLKAAQLNFTFGPRKPVEHPGSHGSTKWYWDKGHVTYGDRPVPAAHPTPAVVPPLTVVDAERMGAEAQARGVNAAAQDAAFMQQIEALRLAVGDSVPFLTAWTRGWARHNLSTPMSPSVEAETPTAPFVDFHVGDAIEVHGGQMQDRRGRTVDFGWEAATVTGIDGAALHYATADGNGRGTVTSPTDVRRLGATTAFLEPSASGAALASARKILAPLRNNPAARKALHQRAMDALAIATGDQRAYWREVVRLLGEPEGEAPSPELENARKESIGPLPLPARPLSPPSAPTAPMERPREAKTFTTAPRAQPWEVLRPDYEVRAVVIATKSNARQLESYRTELATLSPRKATRRHDLTIWIAFAEKRKAQLEAGDEDAVNAIKRHAALTYMQVVKEAISKGMPVPMRVIAQDLAFRKALTARERYEKGRETAFGNITSAVDASMQAERGFKIKRQDGKSMTAAQRDEIAQGVSEVEAVLGSLKDIFATSGLTVAHCSGRHPFLSQAGGMYHPGDRTISIGIVNRFTGKPIRVLAHELGHFLDDESGYRLGKLNRLWRGKTRRETPSIAVSDQQTNAFDSTQGRTLIADATRAITDTYEVRKVLARKFGDVATDAEKGEIEETKVTLGPYWREPNEVIARLFEQYIATKTGTGGVAMQSPEQYAAKAGWWRAEVFAPFIPRIEQEIQRRLTILRTTLPSMAPSAKVSA